MIVDVDGLMWKGTKLEIAVLPAGINNGNEKAAITTYNHLAKSVIIPLGSKRLFNKSYFDLNCTVIKDIWIDAGPEN